MRQLLDFFPQEINHFYEPFVGGGTIFLNIKAGEYFLNDVNEHLVNIHRFLVSSASKPDAFFKDVEDIVCEYKLSYSYKKDVVPDSLKKAFKKTYYAQFNKEGYERLRYRANENGEKDPFILYILLIYGFNRMLRFNGAGEFNLPVGNVDFNKNVVNALNNYFAYVRDKKINFTMQDFRSFFAQRKYADKDFVYFDPPYLITASEYNKLWSRAEETELLNLIDDLNAEGVNFALSNVTHYNGSENDLLMRWMKKYEVHYLQSNYINYHNNAQKNIKEVLVTNY